MIMQEEKPLYNIDTREEESLYSLEDADPAAEVDEGARSRVGVGYGEEDMLYAFGRKDPEDDSEESWQTVVRKPGNPVNLLVKVMFRPVEGWKALKRSKLSPDKMGLWCFLPLCLMAAASTFAVLLYEADDTVGEVSIQALVYLMSLVFSYFIFPVAGRPFLCDRINETLETGFGKNMVMVALSTLALFRVFFNLLPWMQPVIVFMPLWTIYMIHRGVAVIKVPADKQAMSTVICSILTIGLPMMFEWILDMVFVEP